MTPPYWKPTIDHDAQVIVSLCSLPGAILLAGLLVLLFGCSAPQPAPSPQPAPVVAPKTICPGDPPPGYVCAPPLLCRDAPEALDLDNRWIARVFLTQDQRQGAAMMILGFEKAFCGGTTPTGRALRRNL